MVLTIGTFFVKQYSTIVVTLAGIWHEEIKDSLYSAVLSTLPASYEASTL